MAQTVKLKRSATPSAVPTTAQLDLGEVAINTYDGKMYIKKDDGTASVIEVGASSGGGGSVYFKDPVRVATIANGALATAFANGQNIDGVTLATGNRILLKNQSTASQNGIYVVNATGAPTRASDMDVDSEAQRGCTVYVQFGTANGGSNFQLVSSNASPIVVGTSTMVWGPSQGIAGYGVNSWTAPVASGSLSIAIGAGTYASGSRAIAIGQHGDYSSPVGNYSVNIGFQNTPHSTGQYSTFIGFQNSSAAGQDYAIYLGANNYHDQQAAQVYGNWGRPFSNGEIVWSTGSFASYGDAQSSLVPMRIVTTNATATELATGNGTSTTSPTTRLGLQNDSSYLFDCDIVARNTTTDTQSKVWNVKFGIRRGTSAANTALIGTPTYTVYGEDSGTTTWGVSVTADTTNGRPNISVTGEASKTIRWVANIRMTKVSG